MERNSGPGRPQKLTSSRFPLNRSSRTASLSAARWLLPTMAIFTEYPRKAARISSLKQNHLGQRSLASSSSVSSNEASQSIACLEDPPPKLIGLMGVGVAGIDGAPECDNGRHTVK